MSKEYKIIRVHYQNHYSKELLFEAEMETRTFKKVYVNINIDHVEQMIDTFHGHICLNAKEFDVADAINMYSHPVIQNKVGNNYIDNVGAYRINLLYDEAFHLTEELYKIHLEQVQKEEVSTKWIKYNKVIYVGD